jgi:predicted protein tyrosine phosphatase
VYKILNNLATHGITYNHANNNNNNNYYIISKDSVSEEEILTFSEATDEDGNKWLIIDARILSDYKVNDIQDYLALIDTCSLALNQNHRILVCCGAGISRSNAVALGVLYFPAIPFFTIMLYVLC